MRAILFHRILKSVLLVLTIAATLDVLRFAATSAMVNAAAEHLLKTAVRFPEFRAQNGQTSPGLEEAKQRQRFAKTRLSELLERDMLQIQYANIDPGRLTIEQFLSPDSSEPLRILFLRPGESAKIVSTGEVIQHPTAAASVDGRPFLVRVDVLMRPFLPWPWFGRESRISSGFVIEAQ